MNKSELIDEIAERSQLTKADAEKALNSFIDVTKKTLKKEGKLAPVSYTHLTLPTILLV